VETLDLFAPREPSGRFSRESLSRELNERQLAAVVHPPRPLLVVAGAGSGKTRVITYRLARLVAGGADPRRMLAVTFTNKAAAEMRQRVGRLLGEGVASGHYGIWIGTFHAVAARLLRRYGEAVGLRKDFVIYDDDDQRRLMARVLADLGVPERLFPVRQVLSVIDRAKNQGTLATHFTPSDYFDDVVGKAYRAYEERLAAANATDFGGLLLSALQLCHRDSPAAPELDDSFDHVLVDEFQDTNSVQYRLVRFLSQRTKSITVVGDEDQSIYKWRGADIRNILDFERDHAGAAVVKLEQNYRSTAHILRAANAVIARNTERRDKRLFTVAALGAPIVIFEGETERDEAEFVASTISAALREDAAPRDFAVFYRTNGQSRVLEEALRGHDLPYVVVGGTRFYDRAEIKDLIAYLRVLSNPEDGVGLLRIINVPARGIGDATVEKLAALAVARGIGLSAALEVAAADEALLGAGPRRKVAAFCQMMTNLRAEAAGLAPADLAERVLEVSGYRDALAAEASLEAEGRTENLLELVEQMREYEREGGEPPPTLAGFLERIALASDVDGYDPERGAVSLMTVHTAKGLEFPRVFLTGLEEGVFPHARSIDDDSAIEEERRLCYVAVTRAEKRLFLTRVRRRRLSGQQQSGMPSRFLKDMPDDCIETLVMPRPAYLDENTEGAGPWSGSWSRSPDPYGDGNRKRPAARPSGAITVHYDDDALSSGGGDLGLRVGTRLFHPRFGVGEVRAWQSAGAELKVTMRFPKTGVKTILARFLRKP
jgi:DNA helicase II / ATP-dependent DNA helicase PcrA